MKEKYVKLESVLAALYSNKKIGDNGDIDPKVITDILNFPTKEIEEIEEPKISNELEYLLKSIIPEACKFCPNHPLNGGSGIVIVY